MTRIFCFLLLVTAPAFSQSLLWEVSGNGLKKPSYLFGTYHILKDSYLDKNLNIKAAYEQAEGVVVETVVDSSAMLSVMMRGMMLDNSLQKLLNEADYQLVSDEFQRATGYSIALFNQMKPVVTATMLSLAEVEKEGDTLSTFTGQPIDLFLATDGKRRGKIVTPLETMEEQMTFLYDHDSVQKQAEQLVQMVKEKDKSKHSAQSLTQLYLKQDLAGMYKLSQEYKSSFGDVAYLVDERNKAWMKRLPGLLASRPTFVAVGALHLPGPHGLIELLRNEGYTVTPR